MTEVFHGAKVAILTGDHVITILRDDTPKISFPGLWDLPGGGREAAETGEETVRREVTEELGLVLPPQAIRWSLLEPSPPSKVWFFAAEWPELLPDMVTFGDEGQKWRHVPIDWFLARTDAVPNLQRRLSKYLEIRATLGA